MTYSFEVIGGSLNESEWDNKNEIGRVMIDLDNSINRTRKIFDDKERMKKMEMCIEKGEHAARDLNRYEVDRPGANGRGVTFTIDQPQCSTALEEVIRALEKLLEIKIDSAPRRSVENIIKYIISICIDSNVQIRTAQGC